MIRRSLFPFDVITNIVAPASGKWRGSLRAGRGCFGTVRSLGKSGIYPASIDSGTLPRSPSLSVGATCSPTRPLQASTPSAVARVSSRAVARVTPVTPVTRVAGAWLLQVKSRDPESLHRSRPQFGRKSGRERCKERSFWLATSASGGAAGRCGDAGSGSAAGSGSGVLRGAGAVRAVVQPVPGATIPDGRHPPGFPGPLLAAQLAVAAEAAMALP